MLPRLCTAAGLLAILVCLLLTQPAGGDPPTDAAATPKQARTCCRIDIKGAIGTDFTAARMKAELEKASKLGPQIILLHIDTDGGDTSEAENIIDQIIAYRRARFIAFVKSALSAGAAVTLACNDIYVDDAATIGGAVNFRIAGPGHAVDPSSSPVITEKFRSLWRACCRKAAENGGHSPILAEAMVDPDFALTVRDENGRKIVERDGTGDLLKAKGRILTLTAREAVSCGLAKGRVASLVQLSDDLDLQDLTPAGTVTTTDTVDTSSIRKLESPSALYRQLMDKVSALKLMDENLTDFQRTEARKDFARWSASLGLTGKVVQWRTVLIETMVMADQIASIEKDLKDAQRRASATVQRKNGRYYDTVPAPGAAAARKEATELTEALKRAKAFPYIVMAKAPDDARVMLCGCADAGSKEPLSKLLKEQEFAISGRICKMACGTVSFVTSMTDDFKRITYAVVRTFDGNEYRVASALPMQEDDVVLIVELDLCRINPDSTSATGNQPKVVPKVPTDTPPATAKTDEELAKEKLSLAEAYRSAGLKEKARELLQEVVSRWPNTTSGKKAADLLKQ